MPVFYNGLIYNKKQENYEELTRFDFPIDRRRLEQGDRDRRRPVQAASSPLLDDLVVLLRVERGRRRLGLGVGAVVPVPSDAAEVTLDQDLLQAADRRHPSRS